MIHPVLQEWLVENFYFNVVVMIAGQAYQIDKHHIQKCIDIKDRVVDAEEDIKNLILQEFNQGDYPQA